MNPKVRKQVKIPTTVELHGIADKLGTDERTSRFRALRRSLVPRTLRWQR